MAELSEDYIACVMAMAEAARRWVATHPFAGPFEFNNIEAIVARRSGVPEDAPVWIGSPLSEIADAWGANADTRALLWAMVEASKGEGTYTQASAIVRDAQINYFMRASGALPEGQWACVGCQLVQRSFTNMDGEEVGPGPGSWMVCSTCGEIQRVTADGRSYERVSTQTFNKLPKEVRKRLLAFKATAERRAARKAKMS